MATFEFNSPMPVGSDTLSAWHERPGAFERLAPTWEKLTLVRRAGSIRNGDELVFALHKGPLRLLWHARHSDFIAGQQFRDTALRSPFSSWTHLHQFVSVDGDRSELRDTIDWSMPFGRPGTALASPFVRHLLRRMFTQRHQRTRNDLMVQARYAMPPQTFAITGATGLIGQQLTAFLRTAGHTVLPFSRRPMASEARTLIWDPAAGLLDPTALEGVDHVIHLAGAGIADERWTEARKREIMDSRVQGTALLARTMAAMSSPPKTFLSASAVGYYGHRESGTVDESGPLGTGFLAQVCARWEEAAEPARAVGIRTIHPRLGIVLAGQGGALAKMLLPFQLGAGGPIGSGRQAFPWIALDDVLGAMLHLVATPSIHGPVNLVAPECPTQAQFAKTLGRVLSRPAFMPLPAAAVRLAFGEMGERALLEGAFVTPRVLTETGFTWVHGTLEQALRFELGRSTSR